MWHRQVFVTALVTLMTATSGLAESATRLGASATSPSTWALEFSLPSRDLQSRPASCSYGWNDGSSSCCSTLGCSSSGDCYVTSTTYSCGYRYGMSTGAFFFIIIFWGLFLLLFIGLVAYLRKRESHLPSNMRTLTCCTMFLWFLATLFFGGLGFCIMLCLIMVRMNRKRHKFEKMQHKEHQGAFQNGQPQQENYQSYYPQQQQPPPPSQQQQQQTDVPIARPVSNDDSTNNANNGKYKEMSMV